MQLCCRSATLWPATAAEDGDAAVLGVDWVTVRCSGLAKPPHRTVRLRRWLSALTVFEQIGRGFLDRTSRLCPGLSLGALGPVHGQTG